MSTTHSAAKMPVDTHPWGRAVLPEVKIRGPDQGLGPITASKKWGSGTNPRVKEIMLLDQFPLLTSVVIPEQHFLSSGIGSQNLKLSWMGSDAKF